MNKQRVGIMIAAIAGMGATFLPWVNLPFAGSIPGSEGRDGWISFGLFVIACLIMLVGDRSRSLDNFKKSSAIITGGIAGIIAIVKIMDFRQRISAATSGNPFGAAIASTVSVGIGLYVIIGAAIAIAVVGLLSKDAEKE